MYISFISFIFLLISCKANTINSNDKFIHSNIIEQYSSCEDSSMVKPYSKQEIIDSNYKIFKNYIHNGNEDSTLLALELVCTKCMSQNDSFYILLLNKYACSFDGYVSEKFIEYLPKIIYKNASIFFSLTYYSKQNNTTCLTEFLRMYLIAYDNNNISKKLVMKEIKNSIDKQYISYLNSLIKAK